MGEHNSNYLCHYGRLGMRWGEHIYGNQGEYSRQGAQRLRQKKAAYAQAKRNARLAKKRYMIGIGKRSEARRANAVYKQAKQARNKAYDSLKKDAWADKGKKLHDLGVNKFRRPTTALRKQRAAEVVIGAATTAFVKKCLGRRMANIYGVSYAGAAVVMQGLYEGHLRKVRTRGNKMLKEYNSRKH